MYEIILSLSAFSCYIATELNLYFILRTLYLKWIAVFEPVIRLLDLITILDCLLEHTVTITDTAAICRVVQCSKGIQETCSQTTKSTITKCCIRLLILDHIQVKAKLCQCFLHLLIACEVDHIITKCTAHKELHRQVVNSLCILLLVCLLRSDPAINDMILHCVGHCLKYLFLCCFIDSLTEKVFDVVNDVLLEAFLIKVSHLLHRINPPCLCAYVHPKMPTLILRNMSISSPLLFLSLSQFYPVCMRILFRIRTPLCNNIPSQTCHFRASLPHSNTFSVADIITRYNEKCIFRYICP